MKNLIIMLLAAFSLLLLISCEDTQANTQEFVSTNNRFAMTVGLDYYDTKLNYNDSVMVVPEFRANYGQTKLLQNLSKEAQRQKISVSLVTQNYNESLNHEYCQLMQFNDPEDYDLRLDSFNASVTSIYKAITLLCSQNFININDPLKIDKQKLQELAGFDIGVLQRYYAYRINVLSDNVNMLSTTKKGALLVYVLNSSDSHILKRNFNLLVYNEVEQNRDIADNLRIHYNYNFNRTNNKLMAEEASRESLVLRWIQ